MKPIEALILRPVRRLTLILSTVAALHCEKANGADKPNLIVIFTDDQTYRGIGYNNPEVLTPRLDALSDQALIFNNAYVASPICVASRASMMSGVFPQQHGAISLNANPFNQYKTGGARADQTLAHQLGQAGYHCAFWGKSHLGNPQQYGFDEGEEINDAKDGQAFSAAETFLTRAAADPDTPFFLWLAPRQPHVPLKPDQKWLDLYDHNAFTIPPNFLVTPPGYGIHDQGTPGSPLYRDSDYTSNWLNLPSGPPRNEETIRLFTKAYYATISNLDDQIGHFIDHLESLGLDDNTIIIFLSDNGYHLGSHGLGNKITMHEESVRVPMFLWKKGMAVAGMKSDALVSSLDIYPTLMELAGAALPSHLMGKSLLPLLDDPAADVRNVVFSECVGIGGNVRQGHRMARSDRWKYVLDIDNGEHLFDQVNDPYELNDLIASPEHGGIAELLRSKLAEWMKTINDRSHPKVSLPYPPGAGSWCSDQAQRPASTTYLVQTDVGQVFTPSAGLYSAGVKVGIKPLTTQQTITLELRQLDGNGTPRGTLLASAQLSPGELVGDELRWYLFAFDAPVALTPGTPVGIRLSSDAGPGSFEVAHVTTDAYDGGEMVFPGTLNGMSWETAGYDLTFETFGRAVAGRFGLNLELSSEGSLLLISDTLPSDTPVWLAGSTDLSEWTPLVEDVNAYGRVGWIRQMTGNREFFRASFSPVGNLITLAPDPQPLAYNESFDGNGANINGRQIGNSAWIAPSTAVIFDNGSLDTTTSGCAYIPFVPQNGFVYTLSVQMRQPATTSQKGWVAFGFVKSPPSTANIANIGVIWALTRNFSLADNQELHQNVNGGTGIVNSANYNTAQGTVSNSLVLDTTGGSGNWTYDWVVDGVTRVENRPVGASFETAIGGIGIGMLTPPGLSFESFSLSAD